MKDANANHQVHGQRCTPWCLTFIPCVSAKHAQNQPIQWVLCNPRGMHPDMQVMYQACQSTAMHPKGKWKIPVASISSMDRGTHHNVLFLSCALLLNAPKISPSTGWYVAWKGCILTCMSSLKLIDLLPCTHKTNGPCQHQSSALWTEAHATIHHFHPVRFYRICQNPVYSMGSVGPERDASWHTGHVHSFLIHCHASKSQIEHTSSNH